MPEPKVYYDRYYHSTHQGRWWNGQSRRPSPFSIAEHEDSYAEYAVQADNDHEPCNESEENRSLNSFEIHYSPAQSVMGLEDSLQNTFETLLTVLGSNEESEERSDDTVDF